MAGPQDGVGRARLKPVAEFQSRQGSPLAERKGRVTRVDGRWLLWLIEVGWSQLWAEVFEDLVVGGVLRVLVLFGFVARR